MGKFFVFALLQSCYFLPIFADYDAGAFGIQGRRQTMEDRHFIEQGKIFQAGIYDGHMGDLVANYLVGENISVDGRLIKSIALHESIDDNLTINGFSVADAIETSYQDIDDKLIELEIPGGATGLTMLIKDNILYVANIGDSEGILISQNGAPTLLTTMHRPSNEEELRRVLDGGATITDGRVEHDNSHYNVEPTRAFGDRLLKVNDVLIATPAISTTNLTKDHRYVVLACDGLWEVLSKNQVAQIVTAAARANKSSQQIAELLAKEAISIGSSDNVSVVVVNLDKENVQPIEKTPRVNKCARYITNLANADKKVSYIYLSRTQMQFIEHLNGAIEYDGSIIDLDCLPLWIPVDNLRDNLSGDIMELLEEVEENRDTGFAWAPEFSNVYHTLFDLILDAQGKFVQAVRLNEPSIVVDGETYVSAENYCYLELSVDPKSLISQMDYAKTAIASAQNKELNQLKTLSLNPRYWRSPVEKAVSKHHLPPWRHVNANIIREVLTKALHAKFSQNEELQDALLATGTHDIVALQKFPINSKALGAIYEQQLMSAVLEELRTSIRRSFSRNNR